MLKDKHVEVPLKIEMLNRETIKELIGYELLTIFYEDFSSAEILGGVGAIRDTYEIMLECSDGSREYISELYMVVQLKILEKQRKEEWSFLTLYYNLLGDLDRRYWVDDHWIHNKGGIINDH